MTAGLSLITELEDAIESGSKDKRLDSLRRITDLFVSSSDRFNDQQIEVFDDVLGQLIKRVEAKALAELSERLAPIGNAPIDVVRQLAQNDDIAVAEPILTKSTRLSDNDLIEIAKTKTQGHLLAISGRDNIGTSLTDVLLQRGDDQVFHKLAENRGAQFSDDGFLRLVKRSERSEQLAEKVGMRIDLPANLFSQLLARATEAVRTRLLALAGAENRDKIQLVLGAISAEGEREAVAIREQDLTRARERVAAMRDRGELKEAAFFEFARTGHYAEIVAALSVMSGAPVKLMEKLLQSDHFTALLIPCKASGLEWTTVRMLLTCRTVGRRTSAQDLDQASTDYFKLSTSSAQRVLRFWQVRQAASNGNAPGQRPNEAAVSG
jgi:uncharacterized protein (DUF2336 family)